MIKPVSRMMQTGRGKPVKPAPLRKLAPEMANTVPILVQLNRALN